MGDPSLLYQADAQVPCSFFIICQMGSIQSAMAVITSPDRASAYSAASDIADVIYTPSTDGTNRLRYLAGKDAEAMIAERAQISDEEYLLWAAKYFNL
jgi:hypothetical protein